MTKREAVRKMCELAFRAYAHVDPNCETACDCFCDKTTARDSDHRNEGVVFDWLDRVVSKAIADGVK